MSDKSLVFRRNKLLSESVIFDQFSEGVEAEMGLGGDEWSR